MFININTTFSNKFTEKFGNTGLSELQENRAIKNLLKLLRYIHEFNVRVFNSFEDEPIEEIHKNLVNTILAFVYIYVDY